jgi:hypothetical protein
MKIYFWKNNSLFRHIVFLTLLLTMPSYPKSALAQLFPPIIIVPPVIYPPRRLHDRRIVAVSFPSNGSGSRLGTVTIGNVPFGSPSGSQQDGSVGASQINVLLTGGSGGASQINVLLTIDNSIGNDIGFVGQNIQDLKANLESLVPGENQVNINALASTNASAQTLQNSISVLLNKLNEIPNNNAEVFVAKQNVINELSTSVVGLEQTNDFIKAINEAVAQSE